MNISLSTSSTHRFKLTCSLTSHSGSPVHWCCHLPSVYLLSFRPPTYWPSIRLPLAPPPPPPQFPLPTHTHHISYHYKLHINFIIDAYHMYPPGINTFIYDLQHKKQTCFQDSTTSIMHANLGIKPDSVTSKQDVCFFYFNGKTY